MINLVPDARFLLQRAAPEISFASRGRPITDIAKECGIGDQRLDVILRGLVRLGFWNYSVTLRAGFVTREGRDFLAQPMLAAA